MTVDGGFTRLTTERLILRPFQAKDIDAFLAYRSDADVARYQGWELPYERWQAEALVSTMATIDPGVPGRWYQFAVADRWTGELVGDTALHVDAEAPSRAEFGFTFAPAHRGKGYATEAVRATIDYAFERLGVDVAVAFTDARNALSIALLTRIGMTHTSTERIEFKGESCDELGFELRRDSR